MRTGVIATALGLVILAGCGTGNNSGTPKAVCTAHGMPEGFVDLAYVEAAKYLGDGRDEQSVYENTAALCDDYCLGSSDQSCAATCRSCTALVAGDVFENGDQPPPVAEDGTARERCIASGLSPFAVDLYYVFIVSNAQDGDSAILVWGESVSYCADVCRNEGASCNVQCLDCHTAMIAELFGSE